MLAGILWLGALVLSATIRSINGEAWRIAYAHLPLPLLIIGCGALARRYLSTEAGQEAMRDRRKFPFLREFQLFPEEQIQVTAGRPERIRSLRRLLMDATLAPEDGWACLSGIADHKTARALLHEIDCHIT